MDFKRASPNPDYPIVTNFQAIKNASIPFIVGEFANQITIGSCSIVNKIFIRDWLESFLLIINVCFVNFKVTIDAVSIMQQCQQLGFGYLGWSWCGNGNGDCGISLSFLDIALNSNWTATSYSSWGNVLINTPNYGIKATSKLATIF